MCLGNQELLHYEYVKSFRCTGNKSCIQFTPSLVCFRLIILLIDMTYAFFQDPTATDIILLYSR